MNILKRERERGREIEEGRERGREAGRKREIAHYNELKREGYQVGSDDISGSHAYMTF